MRLVALSAVFVLLAACEAGESFSTVQDQDTIEAYEAFLAKDPQTIYVGQINSRLEALYFEKAEADKTLEAYETYLSKFPEGKHARKAKSAVVELRWDKVVAENTPDAYRAFLEQHPDADRSKQKRAKGMLAVADYAQITVSEPTVEQVNMAEDPKGEKNGWGVSAEVKNGGDKTLSYVNVTVEYLSDDGAVLGRQDWPVVAPNWTMPVEEIAKKPMKPGETRKWLWTFGFDSAPEGWNQKVKVYASGMKAEGEKD